MELSKTDTTGAIKAGIGLDAASTGNETLPIKQAFLNIVSSNLFPICKEIFPLETATNIIEKWKTTHRDSYNVVLHNANHMDFSSGEFYDWEEPPSETQIPVRNLST